MDSEHIQFTSIGPVLTLADGTEVQVTVSTVDTESTGDHTPDTEMMMYLSHPSEEYAVYGESVDDADAAISFEEV